MMPLETHLPLSFFYYKTLKRAVFTYVDVEVLLEMVNMELNILDMSL